MWFTVARGTGWSTRTSYFLLENGLLWHWEPNNSKERTGECNRKTFDGGGQEKDDLIAWCRVQLDDDRLLITWAAESDTPVIDNEQRDDAQSKPSQPYPLHHPRLPSVILVNKTGYTDNMLVL